MGGHKGQGPSKEEILKKFDKDGDGHLNEEEKAAAEAARREHRSKKEGDQQLQN
jgi:hypothetical protein